MNDNDYDMGWGHGYQTALDHAATAIQQHLDTRRSRFADHPGLTTALTLINKIRTQPHAWDDTEDVNVS